jgi:hypothetical protein
MQQVLRQIEHFFASYAAGTRVANPGLEQVVESFDAA